MFSTDGFMPHGHCYLWNPELIGLHVVSDTLIAAAYASISLTLVAFVRKRTDIPFKWMFLCFGMFIIACGATHVMEIWTLWTPAYWLSGAIKAITAAASVPTAVLLVWLLPKALLLPAPQQLATANEELRKARDALELRLEELRASELRYRRIVDNTSEGVWTYDTNGVTTFMNPRMASLLGVPAEDTIGQSVFAFMDDSLVDEARNRIIGREMGTRERGTLRLTRRDGSDLWVSFHTDPLFDAAGNLESSLALATDITDQLESDAALERSEEQLRHAQKMEAIGSLAGGVAHDFNNLLSVILGYAELGLGDLKPSDPPRVDLTEIRDAALRGALLTRQLLAFSRQQVLEPAVIELNDVLVGVEKMLARLLGEHIELSLQLSLEGGKVHADAGQLQQVIVNLAVNARDAMPDGGRLILATTNVVVDDDDHEHMGVSAGPYVMLSVSDTGIGMDAATQRRIFEPFFTTKSVDKGTGLGLSMAYGIVKQSGGFLRVLSAVGQGTTFTIYLPRSDRAVALPQLPTSSASTLEGSETVLLVEDEEPVRILMRSILRKHGYRVVEAQNGGEALLICEEIGEKIDLLVTDVVMPRMSGRRLSERLSAIRPGLKVLFVSGYTDKEITEHGVDAGVDFLQKPVTPELLLRKIREVLDAVTSPHAA